MPSILQPERLHPFPKISTGSYPPSILKRTRSSSLNSNGGNSASDAELLIQFLTFTPAKSLPLSLSLQIFHLANFSVSRAIAIASLVAEDPPSPSFLAQAPPFGPSDSLAEGSGLDTASNSGRFGNTTPLRTRKRAISVAESIASMPETDPLITDATGVQEENHIKVETEQKKEQAKEAARNDPNPLSRDPYVHRAKLDEAVKENNSRAATDGQTNGAGAKRRHSRAAHGGSAGGSYGASVHSAHENGKPVQDMPAADPPVANADGIEIEQAAKEKARGAAQRNGTHAPNGKTGEFVAAAI